MEHSMEVPEKLKLELLYDPAIPLLGKYPEKIVIQKETCTNQFSLQSKGAVTAEDYWTECQYYDIV